MTLTLCALSLFAWFSANASAEDAAVKPDIDNRMTMSLTIPLSQPEQASPEPAPKMLNAREQEIEDLNVKIAQMQAMIKNLQSSLPSSAPTAPMAPASSVPQTPAKVLPAKAAPLAVHSASFPINPANIIWLLAAAALVFWLFKKKTIRDTTKQTENQPNIGSSSIKTPAYTESKSNDFKSATPHKHAIEAEEIDSMIEEAELYAIHGHLNKATEILNNIISQHPERIEVWLLLLSIFRGNARQFEVIAAKFLKTLRRNDAWREIQEAGRSIDPENPLYFDPENRAPHLRQSGLGEALRIEGSKKTPPANRLVSLGRPRSISDVLVRMGAVTEPELEHVLADFDPKRDGHCGNYLASSGLITQRQLHAALLQQLSGMMEDGA